MGQGDQAKRLLGCTNTREQHSRAGEQMMLTGDEKVEKHQQQQGLAERRKRGRGKRRRGEKGENSCFRRKWQAVCSEVTLTVWSHKTGASLQAVRQQTGMDGMAGARMLRG